jgi:hypothetical protein
LKKILIMRAADCAVSEDERGLAAAPGASAALRVVGWRRWHVAHINDIELRDVHAKFHRRRTVKEGQFSSAELLFALFAQFVLHLCGVFTCFEALQVVGHSAVEVHEILIGLSAAFRFVGHSDRVVERLRAITDHPAQR